MPQQDQKMVDCTFIHLELELQTHFFSPQSMHPLLCFRVPGNSNHTTVSASSSTSYLELS